jgi:hypothetical protein
MIDYAIRIKAIGGIIWFLATFRRGEERGSLSHPFTKAMIQCANFSVLGHELRMIKMEIESFTGQPARLVRLVIEGDQNWMTYLDRGELRMARKEIADGCILGAFSEEDGSVNA